MDNGNANKQIPFLSLNIYNKYYCHIFYDVIYFMSINDHKILILWF